MRKTILAGILVLALGPINAHAVLFNIQIDDDFGLGVVGSGQLDFVGDLSTDGTFALTSADVNSFSLTLQSPDGGPMTFGLGDLTGFSQYSVVGGQLDQIAVNGVIAQGSQTCPDFGGATPCSFFTTVNSNGFFDVVTSASGVTGRAFNHSIVASVPTPATLALLGLGMLGIGYRRRQR